MTDFNLTPEEEVDLERYMTGGTSGSIPEEKHNSHKFLHDVLVTKDTTKVGYLKEEEVGLPKLPIRTLKELALFCEDIADMKEFADYFKKESEIVTSTSLSKDAKLLELAVITRRELADVTKKRKTNKGWFRKKDEKEEE